MEETLSVSLDVCKETDVKVLYNMKHLHNSEKVEGAYFYALRYEAPVRSSRTFAVWRSGGTLWVVKCHFQSSLSMIALVICRSNSYA